MSESNDSTSEPLAIIKKVIDPLEAMRHRDSLTPHVRAWNDILPEEMPTEMLTRNGRFQLMISFLRIAPMAALVLDELGRIIFMNAAAERYWKVRVWDVQGKTLAAIMNLNPRDTVCMNNEHANVLERSIRGGAQVFLEHFRNGSERMSMLKFPFTEDDNYRLIGCFVLPSNASGDPKFGF